MFVFQWWIYSWRWALYFSLHPWGHYGDILQPSHIPHKNCQWVRSEGFSKMTEALTHFNMLHYNDISHQHSKRERCTQKGRERERVKWLNVCLCPNINYLVKVINLIASLSHLLLSSSFFLPPFTPIFWAQSTTMHLLFNCMYFSTRPRWAQQGALLIRHAEPCNN